MRAHATPRVLLSGAIVALLVLVSVLLVLDRRADGDPVDAVGSTTHTEVIAQLAPHLEGLLSYTPSTVRSDLETERALLTGSFNKAFATLVTRKIAPAAQRFKISTQADVVDSAIIEATPDKVVALVFVNVTTDSVQLPEPRLSGSRLKITLELVDSDWLISELDPI